MESFLDLEPEVLGYFKLEVLNTFNHDPRLDDSNL